MATADRQNMLLCCTRLRIKEVFASDSDKFVVTYFSLAQQSRIGDSVRLRLAKQWKSTQRLDQAKSRVEQSIEEALQA